MVAKRMDDTVRRHVRGGRLLLAGKTPAQAAQAAQAVGVARQMAYTWKALLDDGVKFGQTQIWRILGGLGLPVQKPERRAIERDEQAVRTWKRETWPGLKKSLP